MMKLLFGSALSLICALGFLAYQNGAVYLERLLTYPRAAEITSYDWYEPRIEIGSKRVTQLVRERVPLLVPTLADLEQHAAKNESVALLAAVNGKLVKEWYQDPFSSSSRFNSMSMMKTLVALIAFEAQERGLLRLDERVGRYLKLVGEEEYAREVKLIDLIRMTSGARLSDSQQNPFSDLLQLHFSNDIERVVNQVSIVSRPGEKFEYNNVNTQWLAAILEQVLGVRLSHVLREWLIEPLGIQSASLWLDRSEGIEHAYCCLFMNAESWIKVGELMREKGMSNGVRILSEKSVAQVVAPNPTSREYGHGVWLRPKGAQYLAEDLFTLEGARGQYLYVIPSARTTLLRVGNSKANLDRNYLPNRLISALKNFSE